MNKGILPKLLAKENITIQHGNYNTAWFDIKNRVLGLPNWKDMGKDVYDLLIGHEVGHALETPFEGWHDSPEQLEGCPRSYINVIEDARIERKVKSRYPGLVYSFSKGYKKLFDDEFFGDLSDIDWDQTKLIDKINLKAKIGSLIDVPFTADEQVYMDRAMATETFEEVVQLCRDVLAYTKENQEDLLKPPAPSQNDNEEDNNNNEDPTQNMGHDDMESSDEESEDREQEAKTNGTTEESETKADSTEQDQIGHGGDEDVSITDENFRRNEETLVDQPNEGNKVMICNEPNADIRKRTVISYKQLARDRKERIEKPGRDYYDEYWNQEKRDEVDFHYNDYIKEVKRNVNYAVKEFEMRKAAYRYTRATTAKTGSIDVNKLWSYKTNDDIFNRITRLADAKNHGMFMLVDFSGSMSHTMHKVIDQLIHTVVFCKAVNIPFDVYGFTTTNYGSRVHFDQEISDEHLSLVQQISSELKKKDYEEALKFLYTRVYMAETWHNASIRDYGSPYEDWGSTPLNTSLVICTRLMENFKRKHNIDNMNLVVLTDGDTNSMRIHKSEAVSDDKRQDIDQYWCNDYRLHLNGKIVKLTNLGQTGTKELLNHLRKEYDITTIGFFLGDNHWDVRRKLDDVRYDIDRWADDYDWKRKCQKMFTKHKVAMFDNALGYDNFYVIKSKQMTTDADEFEINDDASKAQITQAFKKHSKSKKLNKSLLTNFGKAVAL